MGERKGSRPLEKRARVIKRFTIFAGVDPHVGGVIPQESDTSQCLRISPELAIRQELLI